MGKTRLVIGCELLIKPYYTQKIDPSNPGPGGLYGDRDVCSVSLK